MKEIIWIKQCVRDVIAREGKGVITCLDAESGLIVWRKGNLRRFMT